MIYTRSSSVVMRKSIECYFYQYTMFRCYKHVDSKNNANIVTAIPNGFCCCHRLVIVSLSLKYISLLCVPLFGNITTNTGLHTLVF
mgnify:CR=1 FL=1